MDWAEMLERMYQRWAADQGFSCQTTDRMPGEEAGIKAVEMVVRGRWAYGYLKGGLGGMRRPSGCQDSIFCCRSCPTTSVFKCVEVYSYTR